MKIYAYAQDNNIDLTDYIGTDTWIKVYLGSTKTAYVRLLNRDKTGKVTYNKIPSFVVEKFKPSANTLGMLLNEQHTGTIGNFTAVSPLVLLDTDEIMQKLSA